MASNRKAIEVAGLIEDNCEKYHAGQINRETWSAEQNRLWALAASLTVAAEVMRLVCPSLGARS